jgi:prepilin-type N-terminal cleavage/methylation domain-containing protein
MKTQLNFPRHRQAFTLIELLVVMAVMAVLAAMIFPAIGGIKKRATIKRVETQLKAIESAIDTYKANVKVFPPENPGNPLLNPLFYELAGTASTGPASFQTGSGVVIANVPGFFGVGVQGFVNVARGGGDEGQAAKNCINNLKPSQYLEVNIPTGTGTVLGITDIGPVMFTNTASGKTINPWRYASSSAINNPGGYDLWVDVIISGKTNRISNFNDKPTLVYY